MHKCRSYGPDKSGQMHAQRAHIHQTEIVTTMTRLLQAGLTKIVFKFLEKLFWKMPAFLSIILAHLKQNIAHKYL